MMSHSRSLIRRREYRGGFTLVSLLVVIAVVAVLIAILLPALSRARDMANRIKCASNLHQIGEALLLYANDNRTHYPRTQYIGGDSVIPDVTNTGFDSPDPFSADTKTPANCVPSALFLLLRTEHISSQVFICPGTWQTPDEYGGGGNAPNIRCNFTDLARNLSYSMENPYPDNGAVAAGFKWDQPSLDQSYAILADLNPGLQSGQTVLTITPDSAPVDMRSANSRNHGLRGQNVLFGDGHFEFDLNPLVGLNRDNIYIRGTGSNATKDDLINSPKDAGDSVLLPVAEN